MDIELQQWKVPSISPNEFKQIRDAIKAILSQYAVFGVTNISQHSSWVDGKWNSSGNFKSGKIYKFFGYLWGDGVLFLSIWADNSRTLSDQ